MDIEPRPLLVPAVITSCIVDSSKLDRWPLQDAIYRLRAIGVTRLELYAFMPDDLGWLNGNQPEGSLVGAVANMDVDAVAKTIKSWLNAEFDHPLMQDLRDDLDINPNRPRSPDPACVVAIATNLPNISHTDETKRSSAVSALKSAGLLAVALGARVVEIVAGPSVKETPYRKAGHQDQLPDFQVGADVIGERRTALNCSLGELATFVGGCDCNGRLTYALEIEPGLSYLLNDPSQLHNLLRQASRGPAISINADLGHLELLSQCEPGILSVFSQPDLLKRASHAHISRHENGTHGVDLPLKTDKANDQERVRGRYQPYLNLLVDALMQGRLNEVKSQAVSLELEACSKLETVYESHEELKRWLRDSNSRYERVKISHIPLGPRDREVLVLCADLVASTNVLVANPDAFPDACDQAITMAQTMVPEYGGCYDKFTGDGFLALWFLNADDDSEVVQHALKCGFDLQRRLRDLFSKIRDFKGVRIALASGTARVKIFGRPEFLEETAVGVPVVQACRMASARDTELIAEHNQLLVTNQVANLAKLKPHGAGNPGDPWIAAPNAPAGITQIKVPLTGGTNVKAQRFEPKGLKEVAVLLVES